MSKILKNTTFWLTIILLISAFLRLYRIGDYMEYLGDQGRDVVIVRNFLTHGNLMGIGPQTSIGNMYLGPWYYYLIAPFLLVANFNPVGPSIMVALFSIATTWLLWFFSKKLFSSYVGLIAAFLFAISPVVIKYSNFSWNPNIMPFFSLLFVYSLYEVFFQKNVKYLILASLAFIFCLNSHYLALLLLPLPAVLLLIYKPFNRQFFKYLLIAIFMFALSLLPQILFDIKHHGQNIDAIITFFTVRQTTVNLKPYKALPQIVPLYDQVITRLAAGKNNNFGIVVSVVLALGIAFTYITKKYKFSYLNLVLFWLICGLFGLSLYKQHIYDHYFAFLFPPVFILLALVINKFKYLGIAFLVILVYFSLIENPLRYPPNRQLAVDQQITKIIEQYSSKKPFNFALIAKQNYDPPYRYLFDLNKAPLYLLADKKTDQLFVVCEPFQTDCNNPINNPLWDIAAFGQAKLDTQWQVNEIKIFRLIRSK